jgi:hypothetical protein
MPSANADGAGRPILLFSKCLPAEGITAAFDFCENRHVRWQLLVTLHHIAERGAGSSVAPLRHDKILKNLRDSGIRGLTESDTPLGVKTWIQTIPPEPVLKVIEQANPSGANFCSMVPDSALIQAVIN